MIHSRMIGDARVTTVIEYSGPTHHPAFLFPDLALSDLEEQAHWLAPHHWSPQANKLIVTVQIWMVEIDNKVILIDTGVGNRKTRSAERQNMLNSLWMEWFMATGATPECVTHVVHTHLHADHVGWNTTLTDKGWVPTFPRAMHVLPMVDASALASAYARGETGVNGGSYVDSVVPLIEAGMTISAGDGDEVAGCLVAERAPGHTPGQLMYHLRSHGEHGIFAADVMHNPFQITDPTLNSRYCVLPDEARETRARLLAQAAATHALIMPMHFGAPYCGYVNEKSGRFSFVPAAW
ncbi:MBL fold metallo-hydrolase [Microvirga antarctica]|uniref:MBL fold metallo-hydrolase n=1 Tax=Microvirga antarctica TaxID=2819233 RepID=UPI001B3060F5|nr:MBL fold metallo-hydrolase [Microvirga antarctica]